MNRYNSHTEPLFKTLEILKIDDLLKVQELKKFYKYRYGILPVYLLNWNIIPNYNIHSHDTRKATNIHTSMTRHEFAKKSLKHNLPHTINDTPELVLEKIITHSLQGFAYYLKTYILQRYHYACTISDCYVCQTSLQNH